MAIALLLIDSDLASQEALRSMLARDHPGWTLTVAPTVAQARLMLKGHGFEPDVVVVAQQLIDGDASALVDDLERTPAIIMVAEGEEAAAAWALRNGFADYVVQDSRGGYLLTLPTQVVAVMDRMRLERALNESAALSEMALEGAELGFWQRNLLTGQATLSLRWRDMLGLSQPGSEPDANDWRRIMHPDDWPVVQCALQAYLAGQTQVYECEYRMRHHNGDWIWVASRGRVVEWTPEGQPLSMCGTFMDVTARRQAAQSLERQHQMLQAISQAQNTFIANSEPHAAFDAVLQAVVSLGAARRGCLGEVVPMPDGRQVCLPHVFSPGLPHAFHDLLTRAVTSGQPLQQEAPPAEPGSAPLRWHAIPISSGQRVVAYMGLERQDQPVLPDLADLEPLLNTAGQLVQAWRARLERRQVQDQLREARDQLAEKTRALELTLDAITQGISNVDAEGRILVHNKRYLELLDLPPELLADDPHAEDVVRFQVERGDFGTEFELLDQHARQYVKDEFMRTGRPDMPEVYHRRTPAGRVLEIRSRRLSGGGRVRTFSDVTDYFEAQEALRASETRWRSLSELSSDWYWEQDEHFRFVRIDGQLEARTGISEDVTLGRTRWELDVPNVTEAQWAEHRRALEAHEVFHDFELQRVMAGGVVRWVSVSGAPIFDVTGKFRGYRGIGRDITEKKKAEAIIERLAFYDELTRLPNRRLLLVRLAQAVERVRAIGRYGALLFLDLDNFKDLNDTLGHDQGDHLLSQVATRLVSCVRPDDTVARLGGDEFVVVLAPLGAHLAEAAVSAETVAQKILNALNQPYSIADSQHHSTPSIGIAMFGGDTVLMADELLKRGDLAMYQAKAAGRNTWCFFDPGMQAAVSARSAMEADLRQSLQRGEFRLLYQPVVDAQGKMLGVEGLVRWSHPQRGAVSPGEFIPLAEQTGLILPLGRWVLQTACRQLVEWASDPQMSHLTIAVNVSAREFRHPGFVEEVVTVLETTGARPAHLKLELTESLLLNDVEDIIAKMTRLQMRGVGFSLDDFGTGYSSLSYLKRLPLDQLKIDQSFVRDVLTDPNDATIARTIIALANSLGLAVVAEGVETAGQRAFLVRNGCDAFQGYWFSRPVPAAALKPLLASLPLSSS